MNRGRFCGILFPMSFCHPHRNPTKKFFSRTSFQSRCVSHMKIANVHVGAIHRNVRIALQFSYQFAIFISVCNSHVLVYSSYMDVCNFHMGLQFSYQFAIFISVCKSNGTTPDFLRTRLYMDSHLTMNLNSSPCQPWFSVEETKTN